MRKKKKKKKSAVFYDKESMKVILPEHYNYKQIIFSPKVSKFNPLGFIIHIHLYECLYCEYTYRYRDENGKLVEKKEI